MDISNVQTALILLPEGKDIDAAFRESAPYIALRSSSSAKVTESSANNLPNNELFDAIVGVDQDYTSQKLCEIFKLLKPNSYFYIAKVKKEKNLSFPLKVSGFVLSHDSESLIVARKPEYEVGSAVKIDVKSGNSDGQTAKKIWSISANDDIADDDLINEDDLLDEEDKVRPSADELRVCGTTKQRKACANCSCGLKEELEQEEISKIRENSQNAKSSCGSCYLGDAFRCASCPYRGMPAFKPGEKVVIDNSDDL